MTTKDRANCWSITINNPTEQDLKPSFPNEKWIMKGQLEEGKQGTKHYQAILYTPQVRAAQVKKALPRAHIEIAKNKVALEKYVKKEDTRLAEVPDISNNIPTLFDYQHTIASRWDDIEFAVFAESYSDEHIGKHGLNDIALDYVDKLVAQDIEDGVCGVEYIAINPMWRSAWKKFYKSMVIRERLAEIKTYGIDIEDAPPQEPPTQSPNEAQSPSQEISDDEC